VREEKRLAVVAQGLGCFRRVARNAKKRARNTWRTWLGEHDDFAKARDGMKEFARGIWRAHKDVREDVGPHLLSMLNVSSM
jgi:hypothetical protein